MTKFFNELGWLCAVYFIVGVLVGLTLSTC